MARWSSVCMFAPERAMVTFRAPDPCAPIPSTVLQVNAKGRRGLSAAETFFPPDLSKRKPPPERWGFMSQAAGVGAAGAIKVTRYRF
jgi:hypothetical protein